MIDDNVDAAVSLSMLLQLANFEVETAFDGLQAITKAASFRPARVILDIGMPGMDGYQVAQAIRSSEGGADVRLIALTGWGQPEDRARSASAGFDAHLVKPVKLDDLLSLFANLDPVQR